MQPKLFSRSQTADITCSFHEAYFIKMSGQDKKSGSVKSSEYSGTSNSAGKAKEQVVIDPRKAQQAISSGTSAQDDRRKRKEQKAAQKK